MKIPIPNSEQNQLDPFYRYKRDELKYNKQGQFYVLENLDVIAKQIHAEIPALLIFMTKQMGQPVTLNKKTNVIAVKSLPKDIESVLEEYICGSIVCKKCQLPELNSKEECSACGINKK